MKRLFQIQLAACAVVLLTLLLAELAARLLEIYPASAWLWYVNLMVFRPIQQVGYLNSPLSLLVGPGTLWVVLALLAGGFVWMRARQPLASALVSHLCLLATVAVGRGWTELHGGGTETAALGPVLVMPLPQMSQADLMVLGLICASAVAALCAHLTFLVDFGGALRSRWLSRP